MALTREDLDVQGCGNPTCTHDHTVLFLTALCHQKAGLAVRYDKRDGAIHVLCARCENPVATIAVARSELVQ